MKTFHNISKTALILVYLVIIAGAVVRMTGSGMGCPDWPKCFGYYIPPSEESEIKFKPNKAYEKGIIIIQNDSLWKADEDFKSSSAFSKSDWTHYSKHDYAKYNPTHTWIEYINRLTGALSGIPILIFTILSFWLWRKNKWLTIVSIFTLVGMGFQAWLGKTVVDSNLAPYKITIHMVMALIIVALLLYLIYASREKSNSKTYDKLFHSILIVTILLTLVQVALGTQVRQFVDEQVKLLGYEKLEWLSSPPFSFYIHRTFSVIVLVLNLFLFFRNKKLELGYQKINWVLIFIGLEVITGIAMYYFDFPFLSQPLHLVIAALLFGVQFYLYLESRKQPQSIDA
ncbi:COX15/CtaA family protein [Winogradskyella sp. 3972H.M.0a.05]|uniref:COX15/CtaA family protein n=1 Tax=Winogradskyella sp. 3972H.M.0a.05 TaxID=2950277 RepID=UPI0033982CFD